MNAVRDTSVMQLCLTDSAREMNGRRAECRYLEARRFKGRAVEGSAAVGGEFGDVKFARQVVNDQQGAEQSSVGQSPALGKPSHANKRGSFLFIPGSCASQRQPQPLCQLLQPFAVIVAQRLGQTGLAHGLRDLGSASQRQIQHAHFPFKKRK